jgi:hypothetical protein
VVKGIKLADQDRPDTGDKAREKVQICRSVSYENKAKIARFEDIYLIEERVRELVLRINALPDICTYTSCGGHTNPDEDSGQAGEHDFYVGFFIKPTPKGLRSLGVIDQADSNIDDENLLIRVWNDSTNPNFTAFLLTGKNGVLPAKLADEVYTLGKIWIEGLWTEREFF